jgi:hypothetical protein
MFFDTECDPFVPVEEDLKEVNDLLSQYPLSDLPSSDFLRPVFHVRAEPLIESRPHPFVEARPFVDVSYAVTVSSVEAEVVSVLSGPLL